MGSDTVAISSTKGSALTDVTCEVVYKHFAIHPEVADLSPMRFTGRWALTHCLTGMQMCVGDDYEHVYQGAGEFAKLPVDWEFTDPKAPETMPADIRAKAREIRMHVGLGLYGFSADYDDSALTDVAHPQEGVDRDG